MGDYIDMCESLLTTHNYMVKFVSLQGYPFGHDIPSYLAVIAFILHSPTDN